MAEIYVVGNKSDENVRLDIFVFKHKNNISRTYIQKLITERYITVNSRFEKSGYKIKCGDQVEIDLPEPADLKAEPENIPLEIVYEDEDLIIINKPAGMVVHPAPGNTKNTLVNAVLYHSKNLSGINGILRPGIVHRLDKDTSGLMVIAKNDITHRKLQGKWQKREISRKYIALVHGRFLQKKFTVKAPIGRDPIDRQKMKVTDKNSREAVTHFEVIETFKNYSLINAKLDTGRTHQVRVHLAFIKHPVAGDVVYGSKKDTQIINRQALHSAFLSFNHPVNNRYIEFASVLPEDMKRAIEFVKNI
ncbi:RluA family pseudouridine synthase [Candidatus Desantisbacteria bacterium]|nr:RluA family pseudouridine synthase [Candidatus Desantisbacteria bacterium]